MKDKQERHVQKRAGGLGKDSWLEKSRGFYGGAKIWRALWGKRQKTGSKNLREKQQTEGNIRKTRLRKKAGAGRIHDKARALRLGEKTCHFREIDKGKPAKKNYHLQEI